MSRFKCCIRTELHSYLLLFFSTPCIPEYLLAAHTLKQLLFNLDRNLFYIEGVCIHYLNFLAEPSPLHTTTIVEKCTLKLVDEYKHMLCQATEPLSTFLEYITYVNSSILHLALCKLSLD